MMMDKVFKIGDKVELVGAAKALKGFGFELTGIICKINSDNTYNIETKDCIHSNVPISVLKLVSEAEGFKSQQEIWEYLSVEGNKILSKDTGWQYLFIQGSVHRLVDGVDDGVVYNIFINIHNFVKYIEPVQANWYDNIPEQGVLCWVSDTWAKHPKDEKCQIVFKYVKDSLAPFKTKTTPWKYATPVTQEEVNNFIYKPTV